MKNLKVYLIFFYLLFYIGVIYSQNWPVIFGDDIGAHCRGLAEDYDNGFLLSGHNGDNQIQAKIAWLLKTDINGKIIWEKRYGNEDYYSSIGIIKKTIDFGCLISGSTTKFDPESNFDPLFMKINSCGEIEWCTIIHDETISWDNYGTGIIELKNGRSIGMIKYYGDKDQKYRISLVKFDTYGEPMWIKHLAQNDSTVYNEEGYDLILTSDSNYLVAGHRNGASQPYFIMCDSNGDEEWALSWEKDDVLSGSVDKVIEKDNGIFYAIGGGVTLGYPLNPLFLKLDKYGNGIYHKAILGDTITGGGGGPMTILNDTVFAVGYNWTVSSYPHYGFSGVATIDTLGNIINRRLLVEQLMEPANIIKTSDNKIVATGNYYLDNNWDIYLWKMNTQLQDDSVYTQPLVYDSLCPDQIISDTIDLDCGLYVDIGDILSKEEFENQLKVFPNPAKTKITITLGDMANGTELKLYNTNGQVVSSQEIINSQRQYFFDVNNLPGGLYIVTLWNSGTLIDQKKVVINNH